MVKGAFAVSDVQGGGFPRLESLREVALVDSRSGAVQCAVLCFSFIFRNILAQQSNHTTIQRAQRLMKALRFAITLLRFAGVAASTQGPTQGPVLYVIVSRRRGTDPSGEEQTLPPNVEFARQMWYLCEN